MISNWYARAKYQSKNSIEQVNIKNLELESEKKNKAT